VRNTKNAVRDMERCAMQRGLLISIVPNGAAKSPQSVPHTPSIHIPSSHSPRGFFAPELHEEPVMYYAATPGAQSESYLAHGMHGYNAQSAAAYGMVPPYCFPPYHSQFAPPDAYNPHLQYYPPDHTIHNHQQHVYPSLAARMPPASPAPGRFLFPVSPVMSPASMPVPPRHAAAAATYSAARTRNTTVSSRGSTNPAPDNALDLDRIERGLDTRTTVMIKNIPNKMSDKDLLAFIEQVVERGIDFFYLRMDFRNGLLPFSFFWLVVAHES
jgi:hypothetical protein